MNLHFATFAIGKIIQPQICSVAAVTQLRLAPFIFGKELCLLLDLLTEADEVKRGTPSPLKQLKSIKDI